MNASTTLVLIAPLQTEHIDAAAEIERCSNSHPWTAGNFRDALQAGYLSLGAWQNGTLVGFAIFRTLLDEAELLLIAVAPGHRRRGIATRLWANAISSLLKAQVIDVHLEVRASNQKAQLLYTTLGFESVGRRKNYYPSGGHDNAREDAILMKSRL